MQRAEQEIIKQIQSFQEDFKVLKSLSPQSSAANMKKVSALYQLDPLQDEDGILRVGGRIQLADMPYEVKHPVILPRKSHITSLIIRPFHEKVNHHHRGIALNEIKNSGFWITGGSSEVTRHLSECVTCH